MVFLIGILKRRRREKSSQEAYNIYPKKGSNSCANSGGPQKPDAVEKRKTLECIFILMKCPSLTDHHNDEGDT